ncbi:MAG: UvrB/UvrC motif-containing protein [Actinobacteria bacterium]|nr:UvrB/UvrC motif-containing protein [Actinomycetota bacterium]
MGSADGVTEPPEPARSGPRSQPAAGRARELVGRRRPRKAPETGRVHHLGAAPAVMPVLSGDDGTDHDGSTRTAAVQLAARTRWELDRLAAEIEDQMTAAAAALDFELAGRLRDELARVRAELDRRPAG